MSENWPQEPGFLRQNKNPVTMKSWNGVWKMQADIAKGPAALFQPNKTNIKFFPGKI
ncbi:hypothetical protein D1AOALGA4SA_9252 [Olavius algarvensis Delta 1 endosymbiont]|nr:hypothetical protein D1AOALGA4SA_9252 [Olavius algarvensis Delta 1 endosymbiont]